MFEQELYEKEAAELKTEPGDLFHNYEIKGWQLNARIYKIVAASTVINVLAFFAFGQPRLFERSACESPFVGRVCAVLDTVYVGSVLFGTERDYVDKEYEKTELDDADIVWIDQTGVESPFTYPAGYFYKDPALVAQDGFNQPGFLAPGIPANPIAPSSPLIDTPQVLPKSNPNATSGDDGPLFSVENGANPTVANGVDRKRNRGGRIGNSNANTEQVANANTETKPIGPVEDDEINSRPFKDLAVKVNELLAKQELDLQAQFQVAATAKVTKDGKIAKGSFKFTQAQSTDPEMVTIVKNAVEAFNDSNLLKYLAPISGEKLAFSVQQDQTLVNASIQSELARPERVDSMIGILKLGLDLAIKRKTDTITKLEEELAAGNDPEKDKALRLQNARDDLELLNNTKVSKDGKKLMISFAVQKEIIHQMLKRKLDEQAAEMKKGESGTPQPAGNQNTAIK